MDCEAKPIPPCIPCGVGDLALGNPFPVAKAAREEMPRACSQVFPGVLPQQRFAHCQERSLMLSQLGQGRDDCADVLDDTSDRLQGRGG